MEQINQKMEEVDPLLAQNFQNSLESNDKKSSNYNCKEIYNNIQNKIIYKENSKKIFSSDISWNTIYWYIGFCVSANAGMTLYKYAPGWVKYIGLGILIAASVSISSQLAIWYNNNPEIHELALFFQNFESLYKHVIAVFSNSKEEAIKYIFKYMYDHYPHSGTIEEFIDAVKDTLYEYLGINDFEKIKNEISNKLFFNGNITDLGWKTITLLATTGATIVYCRKFIIQVIKIYNNFANWWTNTTGLVWTIQGFTIAPIPIP